jgi:hypothetical protein
MDFELKSGEAYMSWIQLNFSWMFLELSEFDEIWSIIFYLHLVAKAIQSKGLWFSIKSFLLYLKNLIWVYLNLTSIYLGFDLITWSMLDLEPNKGN